MSKNILAGSALIVIGATCATVEAGGPPINRWQRIWEPPVGLWSIGDFSASGPGGEVYVAAREDEGGGNHGLAILKYEADGTLAWVMSYNGPVTGRETVTDIELTPEGVAILAASPGLKGPETVLLNYASDGEFLWEARTIGAVIPGFLQPQLEIGVDGERVVATDDGEGVGSLERYSASGTLLSSRPLSFNGFGGVSALALDADGNAYLVSVNDFRTYLVEKIDAGGNVLWSYTEQDNTGLVLSEAVIAVDDDGDLVVAGSPEVRCPEDGVTVKGLVWRHAPDGTLRWRHELPVTDCDFLLVRDLALGADGETYMVGSTSPGSSLMRIDADGTIAWTRTSVEAGFIGRFVHVAINTHGQVIVAATESTVVPPLPFGIRALRYASDGTLDWTELLSGEPDERHILTDLAAGGDGSVSIAATIQPGGARDRALTMRLDFAACLGDLDDTGDVGFGDILAILSAWGNAGGPEDLDGSGTVGFGDLLVVLGAWGPC